jgi:hypothetical protein
MPTPRKLMGWTDNVGNTGVVVNGDDVTAYGLFVEHYEKAQVIWNGRDGTDIFFQNEMPYDPPGLHLSDMLTIFLNANGGSGGIDHVVNGVGGSTTIANPDTPVNVVSYP